MFEMERGQPFSARIGGCSVLNMVENLANRGFQSLQITVSELEQASSFSV